MSALERNLERAEGAKPEGTWGLASWPEGLAEEKVNRLFVASAGRWRGYFILAPDGLYVPERKRTPFLLLFDVRSWTEIDPLPCEKFPGFTCEVPEVPRKASDGLRAMMYVAARKRSSSRRRD